MMQGSDCTPPGYVEFDATKWLDDCTNCRVKVRRRRGGFTLAECLAQDITHLGLYALPMLGCPREETVFQFTIDVMDRNDGHFTLSKFSDTYVMRGRIRRNVP
jgi:hypothetical protein